MVTPRSTDDTGNLVPTQVPACGQRGPHEPHRHAGNGTAAARHFHRSDVRQLATNELALDVATLGHEQRLMRTFLHRAG